eukprot:3081937-Pleurochrysis_carterae.AAC.1
MNTVIDVPHGTSMAEGRLWLLLHVMCRRATMLVPKFSGGRCFLTVDASSTGLYSSYHSPRPIL